MAGKEAVNGRALEYAFALTFTRCYPNGILIPAERLETLRQGSLLCDADLLARFIKAAEAFFKQYEVDPSTPSPETDFKFRLYTDQEGQNFGVRDFTYSSNLTSIDVSLKHNHYALKHPRIPSFLQSLGVQKGLAEDKQFRADYAALLQGIWQSLRSKGVNPSSFIALGEHKSQILYRDVMAFMANTLRTYENNRNAVRHLFTFLTGSDHLKVVVLAHKIEIYDFRQFARPSRLHVRQDPERPSYFFIDFEGGLEVHYRIKNDSRTLNLRSPSLKLDVQPESKLPLIDSIEY